MTVAVVAMETPASACGSFEPARHEYRWNGVRLVSVTEACRPLIDSRWFSDEARQRGRVVHIAVHYDSEGMLDETSVDPAIDGYVRAARKFRAETRYKAEGLEQQLYSPEMGYAGTTDGYGTADDLPVVVDYKSGAVGEWTRYQLAAYANKVGMHRARWGVALRADGTYKITTFPLQSNRADFNDFRCLVRTRQLVLQHNKAEGKRNGHSSNGDSDEQ